MDFDFFKSGHNFELCKIEFRSQNVLSFIT